MIEIREMDNKEIRELLESQNYGHLGCSRQNQPYVVPIHYVYVEPEVYIFTTEGKKSEMIRANPRVCLQVEDVVNNKNWRSVIINGEAFQVTDPDELQAARNAVVKAHPSLTPAIAIRWMDNWVRENVEVLFRITPKMVTGRATVPDSDTKVPYVPGEGGRRPNIY